MSQAPQFDPAAPWLEPLQPHAQALWDRLQAGQGVVQTLNGPDAPCRFVPATACPAGEPYESFIARSGCVPTRENLHDLFNGLVWQTQPALKARLNELQAQHIAAFGVGPRRGALRDALTLFDENGALLEGPADLLEALRQRRWRELFVERRALWREARVTLFGHALLEQLATAPRKGLTAHAWLGGSAQALAADAAGWAGKPFVPLPVLGVPGWWPANEAPGFYDDPAVFRPLPAGRHGKTPEAEGAAGPAA